MEQFQLCSAIQAETWGRSGAWGGSAFTPSLFFAGEKVHFLWITGWWGHSTQALQAEESPNTKKDSVLHFKKE